ncbi:hypothetical protein D3C78_667330 [compost metagenome]
MFSAVRVKADVFLQPAESVLQLTGRFAQASVDLALQAGDRERQFIAAPRRFTQPERDARWQAFGILDAHLGAFHPQNAVRGVTQLKDVAGNALHGKIFIDAADVQPLGFKQHCIVGVVRDGAAAGQCGQLTPAASAQAAIDGIAVQVGTTHTLATIEAFGEHAQQGLVMRLVQFGIGHGLTQAVVQRLLLPGLAADFGNDLLGQDIQWRAGNLQQIQLATAHTVEQRRAFDQIIPRQWKQAAFGRALDLMPGTPDPLQEGGDGAGRADLADQFDFADIDPQFQRSRGHQYL